MTTQMVEKEKARHQEEVVVRGAAVKRSITSTTAEDLEAEITGPIVEAPEEIQEEAREFMDNYSEYLLSRTELYMERLAAQRGPRIEIGEPTLPSGYVYWDLVTISPIQFIGSPPFLPNKIIAAGELALLLAVLFINPAPANGGPSATTVLGGRSFRIRFELIDLTNVTNGPDFTFTGLFPPIAPVISFFPVFFFPPDPGLNPQLLEVNVTADITNFGQPFAAFATHHLDIDSEPPFLIVPPVPPELQHDIPLRCMVYKKF